MLHRAWAPFFWLALIVTLVAPRRAHAEGDAPSAEELLRLATIAEHVERDPAKAGGLYERALRSEDSRVATPAGIALARLQERQGQAARALETLRAVLARFPDLAPAVAQRLREEITRLDAPVSAPAASASPLELKIRAMFDRVEAASGDAAHSEMNFVRDGLESVGKSALPLLETMVLERTPKTATLAAEMYAKIGEADAVEGLERMALAADPITRPLVVAAFRHLSENDEVSPQVVAAMDRLLVRPALSEYGDTLRDILAHNVTDQSFMARHRADPAHALFWLDWALDNEEPGAVERAAELVRAGGAAGKAAYLECWQEFPDSKLPLLGLEGAWIALDAVTECVQEGRKTWAISRLPALVRFIEERGGLDAGAEARGLAWQMYASTESADLRNFIVDKFREQDFTPPVEFLADEKTARILIGGLTSVVPDTRRDYVKVLTGMGAPFYEAVFAALPHLRARGSWNLMKMLDHAYRDGTRASESEERTMPPPAFDTQWLDLLVSPSFLEKKMPVSEVHIRAALRSKDERLPAILRQYVETRGWRDFRPHDALFTALLDWDHPERVPFLEAFLLDPALEPDASSHFMDGLLEAGDAPARSLVARIACDPGHPQCASAVRTLTRAEARAEVLAVFEGLAKPWDALPDRYVYALVAAAKSLTLREAIPFLLEEFRRGGKSASSAAQAMDAIRAYHDRLTEFEAYADGSEDARGAELARLQALLVDEDPEIRRAAVLALAAMGRTDALPRILGLAKDDPDERVRQAALDAVEKLAR